MIQISIRIQDSWKWIAIGIQDFFKEFFIYYCDSYRQPKIKHDSALKYS